MAPDEYLVPEKTRKGPKQNPCGECQRNAAACPWLQKGEPVPGWTAERSCIHRNREFAWTWHITACPLYIEPSPERMEGQAEEDRQEKSRASYRTFYGGL